MEIDFKDTDGNIMNSKAGTGYSKAVKESEGLSDDKIWYKLDDFATGGGLCDSINNMYSLLLEQKNNLNILKSNLESLKNTWESTNPSCMDPPCNTTLDIIKLKYPNITAIDTQIKIVETQIIIIDQQIEIFGYLKPDNMYFRRRE